MGSILYKDYSMGVQKSQQYSPFVESSGDSLKILALCGQFAGGGVSLFCGIFKKTVNRDDIFIEAVFANEKTQPEVVTGKDISNSTSCITNIASVSSFDETEYKKGIVARGHRGILAHWGLWATLPAMAWATMVACLARVSAFIKKVCQNQRTVLGQNKRNCMTGCRWDKKVPFLPTSPPRGGEVIGGADLEPPIRTDQTTSAGRPAEVSVALRGATELLPDPIRELWPSLLPLATMTLLSLPTMATIMAGIVNQATTGIVNHFRVLVENPEATSVKNN